MKCNFALILFVILFLSLFSGAVRVLLGLAP
jgi:hypothetical protein